MAIVPLQGVAMEGAVLELPFSKSGKGSFVVLKCFDLRKEITADDLIRAQKERRCETFYDWINYIADKLLEKELIRPTQVH